MPEALLTTDLPLPLIARGKVRDIYALGSAPTDDLLFLATDRISAFDHVLASGIPDKGRILTQLSLFWFDFLKDIVPNHLRPINEPRFHHNLPAEIDSRSMVVRRAEMFPVECVVRAYLSGSALKDYKQTGSVCGTPLPPGLRDSDPLPGPIFTPAAKNHTGHDENITFAAVENIIGKESSAILRNLTLTIFQKASKHAESKGLILADTKFEFGLIDGKIHLCDEALTPDSSRFWPAAHYTPGGPQPSYDKQFVRDYLESIHWNKQAPAPSLPPEVVEKTRAKYLEAFHLLTGRTTL